MGHAEYAKKNKFGEYEPDILCSAVSALTIATNNALEQLAGEKVNSVVNDEDGFLQCTFESVLVHEKSIILMDSLVLALEMLSKEYGKQYLTVKFEEV